jgi:lipoyl(octanoyl) transferase
MPKIIKMHSIFFSDLNVIDYKQAWDLQESLFQKVYERKQLRISTPESESLNYLLFCEHQHVYTLGKSGNEQNMLLDYLQVKAKGADFYHINRGGDITYHGPGQIVGYPIIDMEYFDVSVKSYINLLEEAIIIALKHYGVIAGRHQGAIGVWLDPDNPRKARKICAIGVRTSRYVTMHGFAFNINTDLEYFNHINPCGFTDKAVTSLEKELGATQDFGLAQQRVKNALEQVFNMSITEINAKVL